MKGLIPMPPQHLQVVPVFTETITVAKKTMIPIATVIALLYLPFHTFMATMFSTMLDEEGLLPGYIQIIIQLGGIVLMLLTTGVVGAFVASVRDDKPVALVEIVKRAISRIGFIVVPGFLPIVLSLLIVLFNQQPEILDRLFRIANSLSLLGIFLLMWYIALSAFYLIAVMDPQKKPAEAFATAWRVFTTQFFYMTMYMIVVFFVYGLLMLMLTVMVASLTSSVWLQIPLQTGVKFVETFFMIILAVLYYRIAGIAISPSRRSSRKEEGKK